ncbi:hypothetical protein FHX40_4964 [Thermopolyspora flexuosa]|uniref:Uncharacterized protein n=1 Tax=Thermopolyspora flexuosa TaxID=103836 RepID=A0A543IQF7_9ACTN|nr:hypothetical protein FHX40_4964 [Thermopolyspora flexuosa]
MCGGQVRQRDHLVDQEGHPRGRHARGRAGRVVAPAVPPGTPHPTPMVGAATPPFRPSGPPGTPDGSARHRAVTPPAADHAAAFRRSRYGTARVAAHRSPCPPSPARARPAHESDHRTPTAALPRGHMGGAAQGASARKPATCPHAGNRRPCLGRVLAAPVADRGTACVRPFQPRYAVHRRAPRSTPSSGRAPGVATAAASSPGTLRRRRPPPAVPCPDDHGSAVPALACRRRRVWSGPVAPGARVRNAAAPCPEIRSVRAPDVHGDAKSPRVRPRKAGGNDPPPARPPPRVVHPGPTTAKTSRTVTAGRCDDHTRTLPATGSFGLTGAHPLAMGETWGEPCQDRIRRPLPAGVRVRRRRHPDCLTVSDHHSDLDRRSATWRSGPASRNHWCRWYSAALPT